MTLAEPDRRQVVRAVVVCWALVHILFVLSPYDVLHPVDPWVIGRHLWAGDVPYRDVAIEYPPGALLAFLLPGAGPHGWASSVLALQAVALEGSVLWLFRRRGDVVVRFLVLMIVLFPLLSGGFDALAMASVAWSTALLAEGRALGWWVAAAGTMVKLVPGVAWGWATGNRRSQVISLALTVAVLLSPLAVAPASSSWVGYQRDRGVQQESVAASLAWVGNGLRGVPSEFVNRFRSVELVGAGPLAIVTTVVFGALVVAVAWRARRGAGMRMPWLAAYTLVLLVLCASKVLSPQFFVFGAPLAAWLGGRWFAAHLALSVLTMGAFLGPDDLGVFMSLMVVRNCLLVATALLGCWAVLQTATHPTRT